MSTTDDLITTNSTEVYESNGVFFHVSDFAQADDDENDASIEINRAIVILVVKKLKPKKTA